MSAQDPASVLAAACPEPRLLRPSTLPHEPLEVRWEMDNTVTDYICREIPCGDEDRCYLGFYSSEHEGTFAIFYRRTHASIRTPLARLHAAGLAHGALTPRRIRLVAVPEPYPADDGPAPVRLCAYRGVPASPQLVARELRKVAAAVCALATHPDPTIDGLIHSDHPGALDVLADHILERGQESDPLLADHIRGAAVTETPESWGDAVFDELAALWAKVAALCPLIEAVYPPDTTE